MEGTMILEMMGAIFALIGSVFLFLGGLGVLRMPDVYNRIQAGTKATTLGIAMFLIGMALYHPDWTGKMVLLIVFVFFTNPLSSHALARAALSGHIPLSPTPQTVINKYEDWLQKDAADENEVVS